MPLAVLLPAVVIALVALIVMYAYWQLFHPALSQLGGLPVIGGIVNGTLNNMLQSAFAGAVAWADQAVGVFALVITAPVTNFVGFFGGLWNAIAATRNAISTLRNAVIPQVYNALVALMLGLQYNLTIQIEQAYNAATWYANNLYNLTNTHIEQAYNAAVTWADDLATQANTHIEQAYNAAVTWADDLATQANTHIEQAYNAATTWANNIVTQEHTWAAGEIASANAYAQALEQQAEQYAGRVAGAVGAQAAADTAGVLAWAQASDGVMAQAITDIEDAPCFKQCDVLGNLGADISELADLAFIAAFVAWVGSSVADPSSAAGEARSVFGGPAQGAADLVRQVAGR